MEYPLENNNLDKSEINVLRQKKKYYEERLSKLRFTPMGIAATAILSALGGIAYSLFTFNFVAGPVTNQQIILRIIPITLASVVFSIFTIAYFLFFLSSNLRIRLRDIEFQLAKYDNEELQANIEEDFFNKLVKINFKYLDQYYLQTQEQADKSFRLSLFACIFGLVVIVTGIVMMFLDKIQPAYVTTAAGILSEFIAAVFFYLYNRTIQKMSLYHHKLVITQNISLALKISQELPVPEKLIAQNKIIEKLTDNVNNLLAKNES
jgi:hypothetical protein